VVRKDRRVKREGGCAVIVNIGGMGDGIREVGSGEWSGVGRGRGGSFAVVGVIGSVWTV